jgi:hypothetical protein
VSDVGRRFARTRFPSCAECRGSSPTTRDAGGGEIPSISLFGDQTQVEKSDELALAFVSERLAAFDIERTEVLGGKVMVSRALAEGLEPAHA